MRVKGEYKKKAVVTASKVFLPSLQAYIFGQNGQSHIHMRSSPQQWGRGRLEAQQLLQPSGVSSESPHRHSASLSPLRMHDDQRVPQMANKCLVLLFQPFPLILLGLISHANTSQASWKAAFKVSSSRLSVIHIKDNYISDSSLKSVSTRAVSQMRDVSLDWLAPEANLNAEHMEVQNNTCPTFHLVSHSERDLLSCLGVLGDFWMHLQEKLHYLNNHPFEERLKSQAEVSWRLNQFCMDLAVNIQLDCATPENFSPCTDRNSSCQQYNSCKRYSAGEHQLLTQLLRKHLIKLFHRSDDNSLLICSKL